MYCPKCKSEYVEGYTICPSCKEPLVNNMTVIKKEILGAMNAVKLTSVANQIEADLIINLLKNNGIACLKKSKGIGGYLNVYMGYSIYGEDIYVDENDYNDAKALLEDLFAPDNSQGQEDKLDGEVFQDEDEYQEDDTSLPFLKKQNIARIIIALMIASVILSFFMNLL